MDGGVGGGDGTFEDMVNVEVVKSRLEQPLTGNRKCVSALWCWRTGRRVRSYLLPP